MKRHKTLKEFTPGRGYTRGDWDAVDSPPATDEELAQARPFAEVFPEIAEKIRRNQEARAQAGVGGRPRLESPKRAVSIRLDQDVIEKFKATGPGWQSRMNDALRRAKV